MRCTRQALRQSYPAGHLLLCRVSRGFTLIELMVVMGIMAIAAAGAVLALRDSSADALDREAVRLAALLESARAYSRANGVAVVWQGNNQGFDFVGLPEPASGADALPRKWLAPVHIVRSGRNDALHSNGKATLVLGPEPMLPAQQIILALPDQPDVQRTIATDGMRPFAVGDAVGDID